MNSAIKFFYILINSITIYLPNCWVNITRRDHDLFSQVYCMMSTEHPLNTKTDFGMDVTYHTIIYQINKKKELQGLCGKYPVIFNILGTSRMALM